MAAGALYERLFPIDSLDSTHATQLFEKSQNAVREGWPAHVDSPLAWKGCEFFCESQYTYTLNEADINEIDKALLLFKGLGLDGNEASPWTFPLPSLAARLSSFAFEVHRGKGFFVLRGLDPHRWSPEDNAVIYLGICSHIGEMQGRTNQDGDMFTHIREAKEMPVSQYDRPVRDSKLALTYHTDTFCDIIAMQTLDCAAQGGRHMLASASTIYNELVVTRPDLLDILASPNWHFDPRSPHYQSKQRSLIYYYGGNILAHFVREPLAGFDKGCSYESISAISPKQLEALDAINIIAQKHRLILSMQPGDLTFVNNFGVLHSREAFEDDDFHTRHLVRMWLKNKALAWKLPGPLLDGNRTIFEGSPEEQRWNIRPVPRQTFKIVDLFGP